MIISRTPFRISFFGGGTDYPAWYRKHGGSVLVTSIDKYCYLTCRHLPPFFEHKIRVVYSKIDHGQTVDDIGHPAVRAVMRHLQLDHGIEIHHDGDLPARSGMGSSSSFTVGLLHALYALKGQMPCKRQLAEEAIIIEQEKLKETVGSQDQASTAYGGLNHITFLQNGSFTVTPITVPNVRVHELNSHLMLFYTGIKRTASNVADSFVHNLESRKRQLRIMKDLVDESIALLNSPDDICGFGELLNEAWEVKRKLSTKVSNVEVDELYDAALSAGALGGKLTGAGGGGFLLLFVPPDRQTKVREQLNKLIHVPFQFEFSGSQIIFLDPERDYSLQAIDREKRTIEPFKELEVQQKEIAVIA